MSLKNENDCKNKFINSIIEIIEYSNEKPCIILNNYEELIPNLKRIVGFFRTKTIHAVQKLHF